MPMMTKPRLMTAMAAAEMLYSATEGRPPPQPGERQRPLPGVPSHMAPSRSAGQGCGQRADAP